MVRNLFETNPDPLRDCSILFPASDLYSNRWGVGVSKDELELRAKLKSDSNSLTIIFKGDGVVGFAGIKDDKKFYEFYDAHCLDNGAGFNRLLAKYREYFKECFQN